MKKLVGFNFTSGDFASERTGDNIHWSNRYLRIITDEGLEAGDYGFKIFEQKLSKKQVCASLGLNENTSDNAVNEALLKLLNCKIDWIIGLTKDGYKVTGFKVLQP